MQEMGIWFLGPDDPLEEAMATHSSILARKIPWTEHPGRLQSTGLQRVRHRWTDGAQTHSEAEDGIWLIWSAWSLMTASTSLKEHYMNKKNA